MALSSPVYLLLFIELKNYVLRVFEFIFYTDLGVFKELGKC